jgi:hypothetical protein
MWYEGVRSAHIMSITVKKYSLPKDTSIPHYIDTEVDGFSL